MSKKRTLDSFFQTSPRSKKPHLEPPSAKPSSTSKPTSHATSAPTASLFQAPPITSFDPSYLSPSALPPSIHPTYPYAIPQLPDALLSALELSTPGSSGDARTDAPHLDIISWAPFLERGAAKALFRFLRSELPYYKVKYSIKRPYGGGNNKNSGELDIVTPRYTTVFGVDESAVFEATDTDTNTDTASDPSTSPSPTLIDATTRQPLPPSAYPSCRPRPVPACLDSVRRLVEAWTGCAYNMVLVNYYAGGSDSISWHSDDERFLGADPAIASLSLGATRDFMLRHKPLARDARGDHTRGIAGNRGTYGGKPRSLGELNQGSGNGGGGGNGGEEEEATEEEARVREAHKNPLKFPMATGDMILMRGKTQSHWLHSVPKRSPKSAGAGEGGRINITFRRALAKGGTENYYQYNVGRGPAMKWDEARKEMVQWDGQAGGAGGAGGADGDANKDDFTFEHDGTARDVDGVQGWTRQSSKYGIKFERTFHEK